MTSALKIMILGLIAAMVAILAYVAGFGVNYLNTTRSQPVSASIPAKFGLMWEAWNLLKDEYYGDIPDKPVLVHGMIRGALQALGDSHTILVEAQPAQLEQNSLAGSYGGIGAKVEARPGAIVLLPYPDGPAARAGILPNDQVFEINGKTLASDTTTDDVETQLRGDVGTKVSLVLHRIGESDDIKVDLTRELINIPTVQYRVLENSPYGYIQVTLESADTAKELANAIRDLKAKNVKGIVLDLRNNPGGLFPDPSQEITGQFLPVNSPVVIESYRDGSSKTYNSRGDGLASDLPFVVLVNGGTASAAEIMAGAFQDSGKTELIGEKTFGKGSVQGLFTLSDNSVLHVTTATWQTPKGHEIDGVGLKPDIAVPLTPEDAAKGIDPQLDRAVEYLKNGK